MIMFFEEKDLISFGQFMVSPERRRMYETHPDFRSDNIEERLAQVNDADLANWAYFRTTQMQIDAETNNPNAIQN